MPKDTSEKDSNKTNSNRKNTFNGNRKSLLKVPPKCCKKELDGKDSITSKGVTYYWCSFCKNDALGYSKGPCACSHRADQYD